MMMMVIMTIIRQELDSNYYDDDGNDNDNDGNSK